MDTTHRDVALVQGCVTSLAPSIPRYNGDRARRHLIGDNRPVVTLDMATEVGHTNSCVRLEVIAGAGHGLPFDQPEQLANVVAAFLNTRNGSR
jgi:pimeloyl-ACP methyl ester carboxylesterase